jgi:hypothetical protein
LIRYAGFEPQLFDLQDDPQELVDLGLAPAHAPVRAELLERLTDWHASRRQRTTMADAQVEDWTRHRTEPGGVEIGVW